MGEAPKITTDQLIARHLAAGHLLSRMFFPDQADLRRAHEIIFRTKFAEWWYAQVAQLGIEELQRTIMLDPGAGLRVQIPHAIANRQEWLRRSTFDKYLGPFGGTIGAALAMKDSPSEEALERDVLRRWFGVVYTGRLTLLIGSINQHTARGASLNKAIHVMCETDGNDDEVRTLSKQLNLPRIYESSLKKAWRRFKPVAHLCAAYVITELRYRGASLFKDIFQDFAKYDQHPALLEQFTAFSMYCTFGRFIERFVTSFRPHGQPDSLIPLEELYSLERNLGFTLVFELSFPALIGDEIAALETYRAPKSLL
jgi:hypothetical protein